jgi:hypothetical protein
VAPLFISLATLRADGPVPDRMCRLVQRDVVVMQPRCCWLSS